MKKIYIALTCMSILGGTTACSDFLEENPKSEISSSQYFTQPDHARAAVNKLYRSGVPQFYDADAYAGSKMMYGGYMSGFFDNEKKAQEEMVRYCQSLSYTSQNLSGPIEKLWDDCYVGISNANTAIKYIPTTPGLEEAERESLMGQAKLFRAMNYFHLVKFFGDVPLILEPYESLEDMFVSRTASKEVYAQIIQDLQDASAVLNDAAYTQNGFRVTKWVAETMLADVYLTLSGYPVQENHYADAAKAARNVINSHRHAMIENQDTEANSAYNQIRTLDDSNEYIFSREYDANISGNNPQPGFSFPLGAEGWGIFQYSILLRTYTPTKELYNIYDPENDLRVQEKQYFHTSYTYIKDGKEITQTFDASPYVWYNEEALLSTGKNGKDLPIYRYPEILLIAAEAIAESEGVTSEAIGYLADVRARAYTKMDRAAIVASLAGLSKEDFIHEVWTERLREFIFENKIWSDIQRTRQYPQTSEANRGEVTYRNVIGATNPWGATFEEKHLLWPISHNEIQRNPALEQNPGYDR